MVPRVAALDSPTTLQFVLGQHSGIDAEFRCDCGRNRITTPGNHFVIVVGQAVFTTKLHGKPGLLPAAENTALVVCQSESADLRVDRLPERRRRCLVAVHSGFSNAFLPRTGSVLSAPRQPIVQRYHRFQTRGIRLQVWSRRRRSQPKDSFDELRRQDDSVDLDVVGQTLRPDPFSVSELLCPHNALVSATGKTAPREAPESPAVSTRAKIPDDMLANVPRKFTCQFLRKAKTLPQIFHPITNEL